MSVTEFSPSFFLHRALAILMKVLSMLVLSLANVSMASSMCLAAGLIEGDLPQTRLAGDCVFLGITACEPGRSQAEPAAGCRRKGGAGPTHVRAQVRQPPDILRMCLQSFCPLHAQAVPVNKRTRRSRIADEQFLLVRFNTLDQVIEIVYSVTLDDRQLASV